MSTPMPDTAAKVLLVVMGVARSGKTTVAAILADRLGWSFAEADDFHSADNVGKMTPGHSVA